MYCSNCGKQVDDKAVVCPGCGCIVNKRAYDAAFGAVNGQQQWQDTGRDPWDTPDSGQQHQLQGGFKPVNQAYIDRLNEDKPNAGFSVLSFLFPIVGIILFAIWHKNKPNASKRYLIWALISIGLNVISTVVYIIFIGLKFADSSHYKDVWDLLTVDLLPLISGRN